MKVKRYLFKTIKWTSTKYGYGTHEYGYIGGTLFFTLILDKDVETKTKSWKLRSYLPGFGEVTSKYKVECKQIARMQLQVFTDKFMRQYIPKEMVTNGGVTEKKEEENPQ